MVEFAHSFLLIFAQLALGGLFGLSIPGFHAIERGFFKSTGCVYLGCGWAFFLGKTSLVWSSQAGAAWGIRGWEIGLWLVFCCGFSVYVFSLWGEAVVLRARAYLGALAVGLVALTVSASAYCNAPFVSVETLVYPLSLLFSALMLGAVATGMSLGHWYLIELDLLLDPFRRTFNFYAGTLLAHLGVLLGTVGLLLLLGQPASVDRLASLWTDHQALLWMRLGLGPLVSLPIAGMIWRTLQIPQTMAATGLFYVAILAAIVGEFLGRFLLFRTALPL